MMQGGLLLLVVGVALGVAAGKPPPPPPPPLMFSAGFSSDMVLQRAPGKAAVYGMVAEGAEVEVVVSGEGKSYTVQAGMMGDGSWKAYLQPTEAGGEYTVTARCSRGCDYSVTLERVTFGDVYFCSGQSNMELPMHYTYTRDLRTKEVLAGKYANIRTFLYKGKTELTPQWTTTVGATTWYNISYSATLPPQTKKIYSPFHEFSATCMYFAMSLVDLVGEKVPIGLIQSAVGGTQIEAWVDNSTKAQCQNTSGTLGVWWYGATTPFVNTSVAAWLWYQGENNCGGVMGNSQTGVGYGCMLVHLVKLWRAMWSVEPGTTDALAPFGVVTLASRGYEGHGNHMSHMRWSQTGNYGVLPNAELPNTFLAQAYDLGDPWAIGGAGPGGNCSRTDASGKTLGATCDEWSDDSWNRDVRVVAPMVRNCTTPYYMGPIHPRLKYPVGRRLATAYTNLALGGKGSLSGPTISGCTVAGEKSVTLRFNATLLRGESVLVQPFNMTWGDSDSNSLMVCTGAGGNNATLCACSGWATVDKHTYCEYGPGWKPSDEQRARAVPVSDVGGKSPVTWQPAVLRQGASPSEAVVDLTGVNMTGGLLAMRYGWSFGTDICCPQTDTMKGLLPCRPGNCPLMTADTLLPANPFFVTIEQSKCKCLAPQTCDE